MFEIGLSGQMFDSCSVWEHLQAADELGYASVELRNAHVTPATPVKEQEKIKREELKKQLNKKDQTLLQMLLKQKKPKLFKGGIKMACKPTKKKKQPKGK